MPDYKNAKIYTIRSYKTDEVYIGSTTQTLSQRMSKHRSNFKTKNRCTASKQILAFGDAYIELLELYPCTCRAELHKREGELIRATNCVNRYVSGRTKKQYYGEKKEVIAAKKKQHYERNKETIKEKAKLYREANKEGIKAKNKLYYEDNKEDLRAKQKQYREENKEVLMAKKKQNREDNKEDLRAKKKLYYEDNKEVILAKKKQYYESNKEDLKLASKQYRKANKEVIKQYRKANKEVIKTYRKQKITCVCGAVVCKHSFARHKRTKKHMDAIKTPAI